MPISLITELPGPMSRAAIARDSRVLSPSYTRDPEAPLVADRGEGVWIWDLDGNCFLDFAAGIAVCATGHCHPQVVRAIQEQAARLIHMSGTDFYYRAQIEVAERVAGLMPWEGAKRVFFANSGAEALECALKLTRYKTRRSRVIAFLGAFHGRTYGAMSLSGSKAIHRKFFSPLVEGVVHVPYPYCFRCPFGQKKGACRLECLSYLTDTVFKKIADPEDVAAVFVEAIQGEGGYVEAPPEFLRGLREVTTRYGIQLVCDEVQSGMGRTGKMFGFMEAGIEPDVVCMAKGIASGLPLGVTVWRADARDWGPGSHASTFGGNPLACVAAKVTIDLVEQELMANAGRVGAIMKAELQRMALAHAIIGDVRGRGLMLGAEIVGPGGEKAPEKRNRIVASCYRRGLIILGCGENTIRFCPPLILGEGDAREGLAVFEAAVGETEG
jgi:4-aminobutyrate aminotransferase